MNYYPEVNEYSELWGKIKEIFNYLISPQLQKSVFPLKIVFIIISASFLFLIIYFLCKSSLLYWISPVRPVKKTKKKS